jgi:hypothetical protein
VKNKPQQRINIDEFKTEALDDLFGVSNEPSHPFEDDQPSLPMRTSAP